MRSGVTGPGTIAWFVRHEARLAWRDWFSMMTAGRRWRVRSVVIVLALFIAFMHLIAHSMVRKYASVQVEADRDALVLMTGAAFLAWCLVLSQAMESVTRAFYARSDLDLILSSPAQSRIVFAVRLATVACSVALMSLLISAPFINVLAWRGGSHWLASYGVVIAVGAMAAAFAVALTVALFRAFGPRRTRLLAQIIAAVIGAAFVIGLQVGAILSYGTLSRLELFEQGALTRYAPDADSIIWLPARAMLGDKAALVAVMVVGLIAVGLAIGIFSKRFGAHAMAATGAASLSGGRQSRLRHFRRASPGRLLRRKEWALLRRDPWLISQSLMQVLYLLPPALMLWLSYREGSGALIVLVPVLVMVAGQLSGGLAWIAISGEDAPELVATAPVTAARVIRAKVEAVLGCVALVFAPFVIALAVFSPFHGLVASVGILAAAASSTAVQLWFRAQAKRSHFRRRQTSSRLATFAEAFSSISWAGASALAAAESWLALLAVLAAFIVLYGARSVAPAR